jgi:MFS transporter, PPP family, 3-phenylpropionic acid transporter
MRLFSSPFARLDGFSLRLAALYAALFIVLGIYLPFFPLWLKAKGLDAGQIGIVLALPMLIRIVAIPTATRLADRNDALRGVLVATLVAAIFGFTAVGLSDGFVMILCAVALAAATHGPGMPLAEAYAMQGLPRRGRSYGPVRLWGSFAFIAGSFIAGLMVDLIPARHLIWLVTAAIALCALAAFWLEPLHTETHPDDAAPRKLLRDPAFLAIIVGTSLIQGSHAMYYGFSTLAWTQSGLDGSTIAALWALGVLAEIVLFAIQGRLPALLTPITLILLGAGGAILRWLVMAADPPLALLPLLQLLHALSFGTTHIGALMFISRHAAPSQSATAQGYYAIAMGLGMAGLTALAGVLFARYGAPAYLAMALTAAVGGACAVAHRARNRAAL